LLVKAAGKYWRFDYSFLGKRKTLALGVYPDVSLAKARARRQEARELLADGIDPGAAKRDAKNAKLIAAQHTFEAVARLWLEKTKAERAAITQEKIGNWLTHVVPLHRLAAHFNNQAARCSGHPPTNRGARRR
jgi:hypothetical protein